MQPVPPLNSFVAHIDPKSGRFTTEGYNYFATLAQTVNNQAATIAAQQAAIEALQKAKP